MALDYDLNEYRRIMALHDAHCEAWEAYADPARNSLTTIRVKNETQTAMAEAVANLLRDLQRQRGQLGVLQAWIREVLPALDVADALEDFEDGGEHLRALKDRGQQLVDALLTPNAGGQAAP